jgi:hypothetical protein
VDALDFRQRTRDEQRSWGTQPPNMSMTERREPRQRPDRPANRNHTPSHNQPHNGHQPLPLDKRSSIWATKQEPELSAAEFRFDPLGSTHPAGNPASTRPSSARPRCGRAAPEMLAQVREQGFVDSRALCVTPGAAVSWSARWWLFLWPSRRAPAGVARVIAPVPPRRRCNLLLVEQANV